MLYIEILVKLGINVEELFYDLGMYVLNVVIEVGEYSFIYIYVYNDNMKLFLYWYLVVVWFLSICVCVLFMV